MNDLPSRRGLLICVSGPSGVGKGSVIQEIRRRQPQIAHSVSVTTRPPRPGEVEGVHYYFRSQAEFKAMISNGEILEYDGYCDNYYGTPREPLERLLAAGRDVLMDITVPGSLAVMAALPETISLFLMPPSWSELRHRLENRGTECSAIVERRLGQAREEIALASRFQYLVINDQLPLAADRILAIAAAEHCRYFRHPGIENEILMN